jgi:hypothetical protein
MILLQIYAIVFDTILSFIKFNLLEFLGKQFYIIWFTNFTNRFNNKVLC